MIPDKALDAAFTAATGGAELHVDDRMYWEQVARDMLEAAAPFIRAEALRDAVDEVDTMWSGPAGAPYVSATKALLRSIADQWDGQ